MHWTTKELRESGLSHRQIKNRVDAGTLFQLGRGIYTEPRPDPKSALRAIQHRYPQLIFTGATAAGVYGLNQISLPAQGILPRSARPIYTEILNAVPSRRRRYQRVENIFVDTPAGVAGSIQGHHNHLELVRFLESHYDGFSGRHRFEADLRQLNPSQRIGVSPLLQDSVIGASSRMERIFIYQLRKRGLDPIPNFQLGPYHWDVGLVSGTTVVDLDSRYFHESSPDSPVDGGFILDRWKTNHAIQQGWAALRYTDDCLNQILNEVITQVRQTVEHRQTQAGQRRHPKPVSGMREQGVWEFHPEFFF
ncbi:type IV toxin-antitoxin system AbiEi family antitoxin domain-containing protein [Corynebacterium sp. A21]|uniref:type IV toxin-antitoxin system AbiEi family antitoxin domain-containing protein n=1 Tax=Corynebacterium sp. A21 TaxID=3457318 RepID=UPI003FD3BD39